MANNNAKLTSGTVNLKGTLSNAVIQSGGTTDYNELENLPDLSKYALTQITHEGDNETNTYSYSQDEYARIIGRALDDIIIAINGTNVALDAAGVALDSANVAIDSTNQISSDLKNKADKEHTHDEYLTEHQDISGKADIEHSHDYNNLENLPDLEKYAVKKTIEYKDTTPEQLEISEDTSVISLNIKQDTTIVLPAYLGFSNAKEITLFLNILEEAVVSFDNVALWQNEPVLEVGTVCELIFTWSGSQWLGGCIVYGTQL